MNNVKEIRTKTNQRDVIDMDAVDAAVEVERQAKAESDIGTYTHTFKSPVDYQGTVIGELTFDWKQLTGADHIDIENELMMRGKTLVAPEFSSDFLWGMAIRACTRRDENGNRALRVDSARYMPMRDFQQICKKARAFLLRAGS